MVKTKRTYINNLRGLKCLLGFRIFMIVYVELFKFRFFVSNLKQISMRFLQILHKTVTIVFGQWVNNILFEFD